MATLRSYIIGSTYNWLVTHKLTPYLLVNAEAEGVSLPDEYIKDGRMLLNASPNAVRSIEINTRTIEFDVTFSGTPWHIVIPIESILAIYAKETNQGLFSEAHEPGLFINEGEEDQLDPDPQEPEDKSSKKTKHKAEKLGFKVIK